MSVTTGAALGTGTDRWLVAFSVSIVVVLAGAALFRRTARTHSRGPDDPHRGARRRAGALLAVGPVVGFLVAPGAGDHVGVAAVGAAALAAFGLAVERRVHPGRAVGFAVAASAVGAVVAGVRFGPTGVAGLDAVLAVALVVVVTSAFDGLGNSDALVPGMGAVDAGGLLAIGAFGEQLGIANGAGGVLGASVAFLAFSLPPASLFAGRSGRLATGFALAVLACSIEVAPGPPAGLVVALLLVAVPVLDAGVTVYDRARRRRPAFVDRHDHLVHRLGAHGASTLEAVVLLAGVQSALVVLAVLLARDVLPLLFVGVVALVVLGALGGYALRAPSERIAPVGLTPRTRWVLGGLVVLLALGTVPVVLAVPDVTDTMERGRMAAERGLDAARTGDAATAELQFRRAAGYFAEARDRLGALRYEPARLVPGVASNLRAARALADVGRDLAENGAAVTAAVVPEALAVVDGRVPLEEVRRVTPELQRAVRTLDQALVRLDAVVDEPYLLGPVRDAVDQVRPELARGAREARNTAAAARLAPAIFGGDATRRYLLVVQNPAENRGTGGLIGSYGILTVADGEVTVDRLERTGVWNAALEARARSGGVEYDAPGDYRKRYGMFQPATQLQAVNLSPDFPTVGRVLASLAPQAGVGDVDGALAVDPEGLAALLRLTGPVTVPGWPEEITADNVVDVTLRYAYVRFASTPERADFLGDVADEVVVAATRGALGEPAQVAQVLGAAARQGHLALWFADPGEQRLAAAVGASGGLARGGRDVVHVTTANVGGNKLDYYLERDLDYRVELRPDGEGRGATAIATLAVRLESTAPTEGLPQIVAGPFEGGAPGEFVAGENVSYVSVYSPLVATRVALDGDPVPTIAGEELGLEAFSTVVRIPAGEGRTLAADLEGRLRLTGRGDYVLALGSQPMVQAGRARISVSVPDGYRITGATRLQRVTGGRATGIVALDGPRTVRVRIEPNPRGVWERLDG